MKTELETVTDAGVPEAVNDGMPEETWRPSPPPTRRGLHPLHAMLALSVLDLNLGEIAGRALGVVIGATIVLLVIAAVLPDLFQATGDINTVFADANETTLGSAAAATIANVMPIIIGVMVVFMVVGLIAGFLRRRRRDI